MHLKAMITKARMNGVPVYCIILLIVYLLAKYHSARWKWGVINVPRYLRRYVNLSEDFAVSSKQLLPSELNMVSTTIDLINFEREVFNANHFGKVSYDSTMIVVQVHRDIERLQYLIVSLAQVRSIESTIIIFSHSFYDEAINSMIMRITFCRFMQIFYPFSNQMYPKRFPGIDPDDCISSETPKPYCSNRDARRTEHKHHWWWKAHFVFNKLDWSEKYKGTVIFLEEDNYVLPDLLYMLRYTKRSLSVIAGVSVIVFGRPYSNDLDYDLLLVDTWRPPYDKGLAFNKTVWNKMAALASYFCTYDDVSWSYSLAYLFSFLRAGHVDMVATTAPRVFTTSAHSSGREAFDKIQSQVKDASFFPVSVKVALVYSSTGRVDSGVSPPTKGTGGWSDMRDRLLCLDPFSNAEVQTTDATADDTTTTPRFMFRPQLNYSSKVIMMDETARFARQRS